MASKKEIEFYCPMDIVLFQQYANRGLFYPSILTPSLESEKDKELFSDLQLLNKLFLFEEPTRIQENDIIVKVRIPANRFVKDKGFCICDVFLYQEAMEVLVHSEDLKNKYISLLDNVEAKYIPPVLHEDIKMYEGNSNLITSLELDNSLFSKIVNFDRILGAFGYVKSLEILSFMENKEKGSACYPSRPWFTLLSGIDKKSWSELSDLAKEIKDLELPNEVLLNCMIYPNEVDATGKYRQLFVLLQLLSKEELVIKGDEGSFLSLFEQIEGELHIQLSNDARSKWVDLIYGITDLESVLSAPEIAGNPYLRVLPLISKHSSKSKNVNDSQAFKTELLLNSSLFTKDEMTGVGLFYGYYLGYSNLRERDVIGDKNLMSHLPTYTSKHDDGLLCELLWKVVFDEVFKLSMTTSSAKRKIKFESKKISTPGKSDQYELSVWHGSGAFILRYNNELNELKEKLIALFKNRDGLNEPQLYLAYAILLKHGLLKEVDVMLSVKGGLRIIGIHEAFISFLEDESMGQDNELIKKELELILSYAS